ncbi:hypothetical protein C8Q70DRAFT_240441 [Cubamyces menziesii]|nr:hypothetical protein C8Q70DRAFT_240441 [Cubamyces menziesii]
MTSSASVVLVRVWAQPIETAAYSRCASTDLNRHSRHGPKAGCLGAHTCSGCAQVPAVVRCEVVNGSTRSVLFRLGQPQGLVFKVQEASLQEGTYGASSRSWKGRPTACRDILAYLHKDPRT